MTLPFARLLAPRAACAAGDERFPVAGEAVAVYNLAGDVRVEARQRREVIVELNARRRRCPQTEGRNGTMAGDRAALSVIYPR